MSSIRAFLNANDESQKHRGRRLCAPSCPRALPLASAESHIALPGKSFSACPLSIPLSFPDRGSQPPPRRDSRLGGCLLLSLSRPLSSVGRGGRGWAVAVPGDHRLRGRLASRARGVTRQAAAELALRWVFPS